MTRYASTPAMIREVVDDRRMPPWHADPRYGHFCQRPQPLGQGPSDAAGVGRSGHATGRPQGPTAGAEFAEGWTIGKPDVVFEMPETYYVAGAGGGGLRLLPGTDAISRRTTGSRRPRPFRAILRSSITSSSSLPDTPPGERARPMNTSAATPLATCPRSFRRHRQADPGRRRFCFQVHYTPNGRVRTDRSKIGMVFAKTKADAEAFTIGIANPDLMIAARRPTTSPWPPRSLFPAMPGS